METKKIQIGKKHYLHRFRAMERELDEAQRRISNLESENEREQKKYIELEEQYKSMKKEMDQMVQSLNDL